MWCNGVAPIRPTGQQTMPAAGEVGAHQVVGGEGGLAIAGAGGAKQVGHPAVQGFGGNQVIGHG